MCAGGEQTAVANSGPWLDSLVAEEHRQGARRAATKKAGCGEGGR
jgi:hypothetical protein